MQGEVDRLLGEWDKIENGTSGGGTGGNTTGGNTSGGGDTTTDTPPQVTVTRGTIASDQQSIPLNITAIENINGIDRIEIYKQGNATPVETFSCNNEKTVSKTYTARDNTTYTIKVYSKLTATKAIAIAGLVFPTPEVNTYVAYQPKTAENYVIHKEHSGEDSDQSIPQTTNLKWKVLKTYEDGRIELIAATPTDIEVKFKGALGFNNGVYILNDLCKAQYSNSDYGAVARSIDLEDIENRMTAAGITAKNNVIGSSKTFSGSKSYSPDIYNHVGKSTAGESMDYYKEPTTATASQKESLSVTNTEYGDVEQVATYYDSTEFYNLIFGFNTANAYWLASRYANTVTNPNYAYFGLRDVYGTRIRGIIGSNWEYLFSSSYLESSYGYLVRPVVSISSDFRLVQQDGSSEWQIVRK